MTTKEWLRGVRLLFAWGNEQRRLERTLTSAELGEIERRFYGRVVDVPNKETAQ